MIFNRFLRFSEQVLAAVIVAGVQCSSNHEAESRAMHSHEEGPMRIKAQSRISMLKGGTNGYGARVQIREDLHGRKHAHAMAICDCNGQGEYLQCVKCTRASGAKVQIKWCG